MCPLNSSFYYIILNCKSLSIYTSHFKLHYISSCYSFSGGNIIKLQWVFPPAIWSISFHLAWKSMLFWAAAASCKSCWIFEGTLYFLIVLGFQLNNSSIIIWSWSMTKLSQFLRIHIFFQLTISFYYGMDCFESIQFTLTSPGNTPCGYTLSASTSLCYCATLCH